MAQQVFGPSAVVSVLNRAFTNTSPSNAVFANQVAAAGTTEASQLAFAKSFGASFATGKTAADLSALLMTNMGITNAALSTALTDYIAANGTQNVGVIAWQLSSILSNLENDATYGAAAQAWNAEVTAAYEYSSDATNTVPSSGGTTGNEASKNFVLTAAQDVRTGGSGEDFFRGVAGNPVGAQEQTTFNSSDILDGAAGNDSLILNLVGNYNGGARVKYIENLVLGTNIGAVAFDYNVNEGFNEISNVQTIEFDQINSTERVTVNNIVKTAGANADQIATLLWDNEAGSTAGVIDANFRSSAVAGATNVNVVLDDVHALQLGTGVMNISGGVETLTITSQGASVNTLNTSFNVDGNFADIVSGSSDGTNDNGALAKVVIKGEQAFGRAAGVVEGGASFGLTNRAANGTNDWGIDNTRNSASNLTSVAGTVTEVDATETTGGVAVRFVGKVSNAPTNVTFKGGSGSDYAEFQIGNINATGGEGNDTFAFINTGANSTFGEGDSIDGGAGSDTIQIGLNGSNVAGNYNISETELRNKSSVGEIDLRGFNTTLTLSSDFVSKADTADSITVRTDKVVQTSLTNSANGTATTPLTSFATEDAVTNTVNLTMLSSNQSVNFVGGSGSDRIILNDATFNVLKTINGGNYTEGTTGSNFVAGSDRYDTITVVTNGENVVIDAQDLSNVSDVEGFVLTKNSAAATYNITLTRAFMNANTEAINNATNTGINDTVFQIGTSNAANNSALNSADTVTIDVRDLLNATDAAAATGFTRLLDVTALENAGLGIKLRFIGNTGNLTLAQVRTAGIVIANGADANFADVVVESAAVPGEAPLFFQGTVADESVTLVADGNSVDMGGGADTLNTGAALAPTGNLNGGAGVDTLNAAAGVDLSGATITNFETLNLNGTAILTAAQYSAFTTVTGVGGLDAVTLTTTGNVNGFAAVETYNLSAAGNQITLAGSSAQTINGNVGADTVVVNGTDIANKTIALGAGADTLTISSLVGATANAFTLAAASAAGAAVSGVETVNFGNGLIGGTGVLTMFNGAATVNLNGTVADAFNTDALKLGTGGQTVNLTGTDGWTLAGNTGSDTFNLSGLTAGASATHVLVSGGLGVAFGAANATGTVSLVTAFDTIVGFRAGVDKIDAATAGGANQLTTINVNVSTSLADLAGTLATAVGQAVSFLLGGAATNYNAAGDAVIVNIASGTAAGTYLVSNQGATNGAFTASEDLVLHLVGTVGVVTLADII